MAVVEYMLHAQGHTKQVPDFIGDRGHWYNPIDYTFVGWVSDKPDFYVPDTLVRLTKDAFLARTLAIHAVTPYKKNVNASLPTEQIAMTVEEVTAWAGGWYDAFVLANTEK